MNTYTTAEMAKNENVVMLLEKKIQRNSKSQKKCRILSNN